MEESDRVLNLMITGGTFTDVHGSYHVHNHNAPQESGIFALSQTISTGALYDSAMRYPAGKCHPGTRKKIIETLLDWVNDSASSSNVLWLCGPAGSGKSAIMHTIAEKLHKLNKEYYGGSFFFARGVPGRDHGAALFVTLAYQLAMNLPVLRGPINHAMAMDPTLSSKSMEAQLNSLLVEPFTHSSDPPSHPPIMVIDGLDEWGNSRTQRQILALIANAITAAHVPLRFLIASRPEFAIRDTFDRPPLFNITVKHNLSDSEHASDAYQDIKNYLQAGFDEIYERNLDIMSQVDRPWPSEYLLDRFAYYASGQFIYAAIVLKFVGDGDSDFSDPNKQLEIISAPGSFRGPAFLDLDQLYKTILSLYPRRDTLTLVLGGLKLYPFPKILETYLGIDATEVRLALRAISSLIRIPKDQYKSDAADLDLVYGRPREEVKFCHLSFIDFLEDETRSGCFSIDYQAVRDHMFAHMHDLIIGSLNGTYRQSVTVENIFVIPFRNISRDFGPDKSRLFIGKVRLALQEFRRCRTLAQASFLFRLMCVLRDELVNINSSLRKIVDIEQTTLEEISQNIEAVSDECIQGILSDSSFPVLENIAYFIDGYRESKSLNELALLPGFSEESAKAFLIHGAPLVHVVWKETKSTITREYRLVGQVYRFLSSESRGGRFHHEFRSHFIRICRNCLTFVLDTWRNDGSHLYRRQWKHAHDIFEEFLRNQAISDLRPQDDEAVDANFRELIESLCSGHNYKRLGPPNLSQFGGGVILNIVKWFHIQLNQQPPLPLLEQNNGNLKQGILHTMEHICNNFFLPKFHLPFYSDKEDEEQIWLSSLRFSPLCVARLPGNKLSIPPFNILSHQNAYNIHQDLYQKQSVFIQTILKGEGTVLPRIDSAQFSTSLLEWHLLGYATRLHRLIDSRSYNDMFGPQDAPFSSLFAFANPSKKIEAVLWTLHYLCLNENLPWRPPFGFCSGVMDFVEKYELDQGGELTRWLKDLIPRQHRYDSSPGDWFGTPDWLVGGP